MGLKEPERDGEAGNAGAQQEDVTTAALKGEWGEELVTGAGSCGTRKI